jgi:hypothetical protein
LAKVFISDAMRAKLAGEHDVGAPEVHQCFANRTGKLLFDTREAHATDPPTRWFIAPTNKGRLLKVCFVPRSDYFLRTCYEPNEEELAIYRKHGQPSDF